MNAVRQRKQQSAAPKAKALRVTSCDARRGWYHKWRCDQAPAFFIDSNGGVKFLCHDHAEELVKHCQQAPLLKRIV